MAKKTIEVDERVLKIQTAMDSKIEELKDLEYQKAEMTALYEAKLSKLKESYSSKIENMEHLSDYIKAEVKTLFDQVPHKETATLEKVSLISGDVVLKKAHLDYDYDKKTMLEYAKEQGEASPLADYIKSKTVEDFDWASFKATLFITEGKELINSLTGEVIQVDGLSVVEVPAELIIK